MDNRYSFIHQECLNEKYRQLNYIDQKSFNNRFSDNDQLESQLRNILVPM